MNGIQLNGDTIGNFILFHNVVICYNFFVRLVWQFENDDNDGRIGQSKVKSVYNQISFQVVT